MSSQQLAQNVVTVLAPALPLLLSGGTAMAEVVGKQLGADALKAAKSIWNKLQGRLPNAAQTEANLLAQDPDNDNYRAIFGTSLTKLLDADPQLVQEITALMSASQGVQELLVQRGSEVGNIKQRLKLTGKQSITIDGSKAGDISQEQ